ncbi:hypothetical protein HYH03_002695 [Edaphochlamys debaryana]|uniref:Fe2OG dioxygenase domain-containing protein n=1 Tax=Edaphochlamys debaryana TaxID=47281 RepID=A0A835YA09_9CHLO|nr:hypothetical protein HYH03_002695 [Edaphochlamys debaryana]|eukprot:KAG2499110.1 hypothetical protein HYH03_002695 [Edaphochlamys debaryana]
MRSFGWLTAWLLFGLSPSSTTAFSSLRVKELYAGWDDQAPYRPDVSETSVHVISWSPRAFVIRNLLSDMECTHIAEQAQVRMRRSTVVSNEDGSSVLSDYRTSYGTFIRRGSTPVVQAVEDRVAWLTRAPVINQEAMQVLRYGRGQFYKPHTDSLSDDSPRMATVLLYLSDPELGGETAFPQATEWADPAMPEKFGPFSECVKSNVAFKPRRGDALLFWSVQPDGKTLDPFSEHEGCPVLQGVKWTGTVWVHTSPHRMEEFNATTGRFNPPGPGETDDPGFCVDAHASCEEWASKGECKRNASYMTGHGNQVGQCRRACGVCEPCAEGDRDCYNRNRESQGYLVYDPQELLEGGERRRAQEAADEAEL